MIAPIVTQRWRERRGVYVPANGVIDPREFEVAALEGKGSDSVAREFVERHHYSASYPAARFRFGLYRGAQLVGVAVFSQPVRNEVFSCFPGVEPGANVELGRLVLLDEVRGNGETWFLARAFELLRREGIAGVVSFSDPFPRTRADGGIVHAGHVGIIYQAHNAHYLGRARPDTIRLLPDGRTLNGRTVAKLRARERGWAPAAKMLESFGAPAFDGSADWVERALAATVRKVRHPGNHKYAWGFVKATKRALSARDRVSYPKMEAA